LRRPTMVRKVVCGVDEAGRGCVVGPLVIAAVAVEKPYVAKLRELGVADSKTLTARRRRELYEAILERFKSRYVVVEPWDVDRSLRVRGGPGLNSLEYRYIAKLVDTLKPSEVLVDSPDRNTRRAGEEILKHLKTRVQLRCMVHADRKSPVVAAASIVAKVVRDNRVEELRKFYGDFGSGYPSDPKTRSWLRARLDGERLPLHVRRGWKTLEKLVQTRIDDF
jgi:ribonuclease HII